MRGLHRAANIAALLMLCAVMPSTARAADIPDDPGVSAPELSVTAYSGGAELVRQLAEPAASAAFMQPAYASTSTERRRSARRAGARRGTPTPEAAAAAAQKKAEEEQAAAEKRAKEQAAAADKANAKAEKAAAKEKPAVYRLDQGESLPGPNDD